MQPFLFAMIVNAFVLLVLTVLLVELARYRLDNIASDGGLGNSWRSNRERLRASNYSPKGQRLLRWFKAVLVLYGIIFVAMVLSVMIQ